MNHQNLRLGKYRKLFKVLSQLISEELKTNCTWLTLLDLLVVELSVLHGIFGKRKEKIEQDFLKES